jgi:hypothetical protein
MSDKFHYTFNCPNSVAHGCGLDPLKERDPYCFADWPDLGPIYTDETDETNSGGHAWVIGV